MTRTMLTALLLGSSILGTAGVAFAQDKTITIESWRNDDLPIWQEKLIPAFEAANPGIKVVFSPSAPTEYNAALNAKLDAGSAGDLITCRPFDASLDLYNKGQLADLTTLPGMENFSDVAKSAWTTDDGKATFCVPMASVIHGFIYNKDAFDKLGIAVPTTEAEFFAALDKIKADGTYIPHGHGHQGSLGSRDHGLPEHRPELLEGRGRPPGADQGRAEADRPAVGRALRRRSPSGSPISAMASRRRPIRTARTCSRSAAPRSIRPARGRSRLFNTAGAVQDGRVPAAGEDKPATPATSPTTPTSAIGLNAKSRRMPTRPRPS